MSEPKELVNKEKWEALLRGQVMSATVNKFTTVIRMLDQKAQGMIVLNSVLIPVCLNTIETPELRYAAGTCIFTAIISILAAMVCIYPKRRYRKSSDREFNLLHFNDIGHIDREEYLEQFTPIFNDPVKLSETVVKDIYDTSRYSIMPKYLWLKISYAIFFFGNIIAIGFVLYYMDWNKAIHP